jgi:hypothetical protein
MLGAKHTRPGRAATWRIYAENLCEPRRTDEALSVNRAGHVCSLDHGGRCRNRTDIWSL